MLHFVRAMPLFAVLAHLIAAGTFSVAANAHGVEVQQRNDTKIIDMIADGHFDNATPEQVLAVMLDYEHSPSWQKNLKISRVVHRGANELDVYQLLNLPVISDRDYTLHVTWGDDAKGKWMKFTLANDRGPKSPSGVMQLATHEGEWHLERDGNGTRAHYEVRMDMGGSIPSGMARSRAAKNVPEFFQALRRQLK